MKATTPPPAAAHLSIADWIALVAIVDPSAIGPKAWTVKMSGEPGVRLAPTSLLQAGIGSASPARLGVAANQAHPRPATTPTSARTRPPI
ncbi:MAG TPA: hypothetical protein VHE61_21140, partial [Opitutaceae bacterium]|nr:hypothetical protein [Opitutaceae bacterium]